MPRKFTAALIVLVFSMSNPAFAASNWVEEFLQRYHSAPLAAAMPSPNPGARDNSSPQALIPGEVPVAMSDIVTLMLDKNLALQADRFTPRSNYLLALAYWQALLPSLTVSFTEGRNTSPSPSQINGASLSSLSTLTHSFNAGFSQVLTPGTNVGVNFSVIRTSSNNQLATYNPAYTGRITYSVIQPLLQNFGKSINTRPIVEGMISQKSSEAAFEIQLAGLIAQTEKAYWNLVFAAQNVAVNKESLDEALVELEQDQAKVEIGLAAKSDVVQTNASVAARRQALVTANYTQAQAEDQVKRLISSDTDPGMFRIRLKTLDLPKRTAEVPTLEEAVRIALENRPEMRQALLDMQYKDLDIQYYANQRKPNISITGTYTQNSIGGDQLLRAALGGAPAQIKPGGLNDALGQLFGFGYNGYSAGVSLVMPLDNKAVDANYAYAQNQKRMSEANLKATEAQIALDVRNALTEVEEYLAQIENGQTTLDLAREQLQNEKTKLDLGTSQIRFVLEDQITVATDESALLQSTVALANGLVDLDQAMGLTLSKNNIQLDKAFKTGGVDPTSAVNIGRSFNLFRAPR